MRKLVSRKKTAQKPVNKSLQYLVMLLMLFFGFDSLAEKTVQYVMNTPQMKFLGQSNDGRYLGFSQIYGHGSDTRIFLVRQDTNGDHDVSIEIEDDFPNFTDGAISQDGRYFAWAEDPRRHDVTQTLWYYDFDLSEKHNILLPQWQGDDITFRSIQFTKNNQVAFLSSDTNGQYRFYYSFTFFDIASGNLTTLEPLEFESSSGWYSIESFQMSGDGNSLVYYLVRNYAAIV